MPRTGDERGFALPLTILVVTVMTMLIAAAHVRVRADRVIAESSGATVDAFAVAQSGLHSYFGIYEDSTSAPPDGDSLRINVPHGYADVRAFKVKSSPDSTEHELYIVRSTGHLIEPTRGSDPQAQRTVAQFAQWQNASMHITGVVTAVNDWVIGPSTGVYVRGWDHCPQPAPNVTGVLTTASSPINSADFAQVTSLIKTGTGSAIADSTRIDWASIVGGQFEADYDYYPGFDPSYPTMLITGDTTITDLFGRGLLMVTGDLTLTGNVANFRGVLLVGGRLTINIPSPVVPLIRGVTVTGLNAQLGMSPPANQLIGGSLHFFEYWSCEVRNALNSLIGFVPTPNAWIDNWAMY